MNKKTKENIKRQGLQVRLSECQLKEVEFLAKNQGTKPTEAVRSLIPSAAVTAAAIELDKLLPGTFGPWAPLRTVHDILIHTFTQELKRRMCEGDKNISLQYVAEMSLQPDRANEIIAELFYKWSRAADGKPGYKFEKISISNRSFLMVIGKDDSSLNNTVRP